ncbi:MAG: hypothetical protein MZW92_35180 [Comamonadaceae bacterium]|nr:hypothetical protein [Comamonadaceae bacterium]
MPVRPRVHRRRRRDHPRRPRMRAGVGLPYGCNERRLRLAARARVLEGRVVHGAAPAQALSAEEQAQGLRAGLLQPAADRSA